MAGILERVVRPFVRSPFNGGKEKTEAIFTKINDLDRRLTTIEEERQRSIEALTELFDGLPAYVIYKDSRNRLVMVNQYAAHAVGRRPEDMVGREAVEFWPEAVEDYPEDARILETGEAPAPSLSRVTLSSGEERTLRTWKRPVRDALGRAVGVILFALDLSEVGDAQPCAGRTCSPYPSHVNPAV